MNIKTPLLLSLSFILFFSCKSPKETDDLSTMTAEMQMQKNPCFGKCPAYILTINKGGIAVFDGRKFVKKYGVYTKKLNKQAYKKLRKAFKAANFWTLDDNYPSNIPDLPKTKLTFHQKGKSKSVVGDINRPQVIKDLEELMEEIANGEGWNLRSVPDANLPDMYITDELIISLKKSADIKEWVKKYADYDLKVKSNISPNKNLWLVNYNETKIKPNQIMSVLSIDEDILVLEFNKKVEARGE